MPIRYEVVPTTLAGVNYAARVRPQHTVTLSELLQDINDESSLAPEDIAGTVTAFIRHLQKAIARGDNVIVDGLALFGASISAKMDTPTQDLPADAKINVTARAHPRLLGAVREAATVERIETSDPAPHLVSVTARTGALSSLTANMVIEVLGERLNFDPAHPTEGVFFVKLSDNSAVRATNYINRGEKKLTLAVPSGIAAGTGYALEVRARRRGSTHLRKGVWGTTLNV